MLWGVWGILWLSGRSTGRSCGVALAWRQLPGRTSCSRARTALSLPSLKRSPPPHPHPSRRSLDQLDSLVSAEVAALAADGPSAEELQRYKKVGAGSCAGCSCCAGQPAAGGPVQPSVHCVRWGQTRACGPDCASTGGALDSLSLGSVAPQMLLFVKVCV